MADPGRRVGLLKYSTAVKARLSLRFGSFTSFLMALPDVRFPPDSDGKKTSLDVGDVPFAVWPLFNHAVYARKKRWRESQAQRIGCCHVEYQLELGRLENRNIAGVLALEDTLH
jgi:hypothetical protein